MAGLGPFFVIETQLRGGLAGRIGKRRRKRKSESFWRLCTCVSGSKQGHETDRQDRQGGRLSDAIAESQYVRTYVDLVPIREGVGSNMQGRPSDARVDVDKKNRVSA